MEIDGVAAEVAQTTALLLPDPSGYSVMSSCACAVQRAPARRPAPPESVFLTWSVSFYLQIMLLAPAQGGLQHLDAAISGRHVSPGRNCSGPLCPVDAGAAASWLTMTTKCCAKVTGNTRMGSVRHRCAGSCRPQPLLAASVRERHRRRGRRGNTTAASARYHFVNSATHRLRIMGKSMGAIPGATPAMALRSRKTGDETLSWCSCGTGSCNDRNNKRGMTQTFVAFALANGNGSLLSLVDRLYSRGATRCFLSPLANCCCCSASSSWRSWMA